MTTARLAVLAAVVVSACAAANETGSTATTAPNATATHAHPSDHAMSHAFERIQPDAVRCLTAGEHVTVRGAFRGADGHFVVDRIESSRGVLPYATETCLRVASEHAHVRAFSDATASYAASLDGGNAPGGESTIVASGSTNAAGTPPSPRNPPYVPTGAMTIAARPAPVEMIRRESDALQRCYEQACERDHTISGHVELHLVLDTAGHITRLSSRTDSSNEDHTLMELVARCIESHVQLIQFGPQAIGGQETVVPLSFQPGGIPID